MTITCTKHPKYPAPEWCPGCKAAANKAQSVAATEHGVVAEVASTAAKERARIQREAIDECHMCDDAGYVNGVVCHHDVNAALAAKKGMALIREQWKQRSTDA